MEKKNLIELLNEIFLPIGFKRNGNNWVKNGDEISKIINLQKSTHGNFYYINYGYIIKKLNLTTPTHLENRLASIDKDEQKRITDLLNLEENIPESQRLSELKKLILDKVVKDIISINTEDDILKELKKLPYLSRVPLNVKKHFNLINPT